MKKFKHKQTGHIATETHSEKNYKVSHPQNYTIPKWIIENSNDWEEIVPFIETTDGVGLREGDTIWYYYYIEKQVRMTNIVKANIGSFAGYGKYTFSSREAAENHLNKNKPKFSIQNIEDAYIWDKSAPLYQTFINNLKEIVGE